MFVKLYDQKPPGRHTLQIFRNFSYSRNLKDLANLAVEKRMYQQSIKFYIALIIRGNIIKFPNIGSGAVA